MIGNNLTVKIYIIEESHFDKNGDLIFYQQHDYKADTNEERGWFFYRSKCQDYADDLKSSMALALEGQSVNLQCVDRCLCDLYWIKIRKSLSKRQYKRATKLFIAGAMRMFRDYTEKLYVMLKLR